MARRHDRLHTVLVSLVAPAGCLPYGYDVASASGAGRVGFASVARRLTFLTSIEMWRIAILEGLWASIATTALSRVCDGRNYCDRRNCG